MVHLERRRGAACGTPHVATWPDFALAEMPVGFRKEATLPGLHLRLLEVHVRGSSSRVGLASHRPGFKRVSGW